MTTRGWITRGLVAVSVALSFALILLPDWKPGPPMVGDYGSCLASHLVSTVQPIYGVDSNGGTTVMYMPTTTTVCDRREFPDGDGPDYQRRYREYLERLEAWHKRHPEKE